MWQFRRPYATRFNVFIAGSNRRGAEKPWNQPFFGKSYMVGPNGRLENQSKHPNLVIADVDLESLSEPDAAGWNLPRDSRVDWLPQMQKQPVNS